MERSKHVNLNDAENYIRNGKYPNEVKEKGAKRNFRKSCKHFTIVEGHLTFKNTRRVIFENDRKQAIIHDVHEGLNETVESVALSGHRGRDSTYQKVSQRFYWHGMVDDVKSYIKTCQKCQQHGKLIKKISPELQSIPIEPNVMKQVGIDLCNLPEVNGYKHLIVLIDYFSKWSEAKPVKDKSAPTVARFLYEMICRHGCFKTQINDQGREFVNQVSDALLELTGTDQRVTSAYHPQSNGLCERQNRTIKDSLVKVLEENPAKWPDVIDGVLFAHRASIHSSTKFSPFYLMYNRHPTLPIDVKYDLIKEPTDGGDGDDPYDFEMFRELLASSSKLREATHDDANENIKKAQQKQQKDYNKRHCKPESTVPINSKVLLQNLKRQDRKGGKFKYKWVGPYTLTSISKSGLCELTNSKGVTLKNKYNVSLIKPFHANESQESTNEDPASQPTATTEDPAYKPTAAAEHPASQPTTTDERSASRPTFQPATTDKDHVSRPKKSVEFSRMAQKNNFDILPTEIVLMILELSIKNDITSYKSIVNTCSRFRSIIQPKKITLLPSIYLDFYNDVLEKLPAYQNKVKVSVNKLSRHFGLRSGPIDEVRKAIANKNWKSAWLILEKQRYSWFFIDRIFWRKKLIANTIQEPEIIESNQDEWLHNRLYILNQEDKDILLSKDGWLNDRLMDAAQKLICEEIGTTFQTVLNSQRKDIEPYKPVYEEHVQLLHDGHNHWILSFCSNGRVQVCDSLNYTLTRSSRKAIQSLYKNYFSGTVVISFIEVQKQPDSYNCGLFAIAFAAELLDGKSPSDAVFVVDKMRAHFISCLEQQKLGTFPKVSE